MEGLIGTGKTVKLLAFENGLKDIACSDDLDIEEGKDYEYGKDFEFEVNPINGLFKAVKVGTVKKYPFKSASFNVAFIKHTPNLPAIEYEHEGIKYIASLPIVLKVDGDNVAESQKIEIPQEVKDFMFEYMK